MIYIQSLEMWYDFDLSSDRRDNVLFCLGTADDKEAVDKGELV